MPDLKALRGILPPILTPLNDDEDVDRESMHRLVNFMIDGGVHGIWVTGTTGEFPCLTAKQRAIAVESCVEAAAGRVPVVASIGDSSTKLAIGHAHAAKAAGADYLAATPPHYFVNTPDEQLVHYREIQEKVDHPLLVYNIPQTVKVKLQVNTVLTLAEEGTVVGIKDSQNDLDWFRQVMVGVGRMGKEFRGFLGTRYLVDAGLVAGAHGAIPSISNICPAVASAIYERAIVGDWAGAAKVQEQLADLSFALAFGAGFNANAKRLLTMRGIFSNARMVLPSKTAPESDIPRIKAAIEKIGITPRS